MCLPKDQEIKTKHYKDKMEARKKLKFDVHSANNFTKKEYEKFRSALSLGEKVLNSDSFKFKVLNYPFRETNGKNNTQIYQMFMSGKDNFNKEVDNDLDIYITLYYSPKKVIGYTYPSTFRTWVNRKFFKKFDAADILGNITHEYCHNLGFGHSIRVGRKHTVPYAMGYIARDLGKKWKD